MENTKQLAKDVCTFSSLTRTTLLNLQTHLKSKVISIDLDSRGNPVHQVFYSLDNLCDLLFVLETCINTNDKISLLSNKKDFKNNNNNLTYEFLDFPGDLPSSKLTPLNTSVIDNSRGSFCVIFGSDENNVLGGFLNIIELLLSKKVNELNISLGHINPTIRLNKTRFAGYNLKSLLIKTLKTINNKERLSYDLILELILDELQINNRIDYLNLSNYYINKELLSNKLNLDIIQRDYKSSSVKEKAKYLLKTYMAVGTKEDSIKVPTYTMILTRTGCKPIEKLVDKNFSIWDGEEWLYASCSLEAKSRFEIYFLSLGNDYSIEIAAGNLIETKRGTIPISEVVPGDILILSPFPEIESANLLRANQQVISIQKYKPTKGVQLYGIKTNNQKNTSTVCSLPNGMRIYPNLVPKECMDDRELYYRLSTDDLIISEQTLAKSNRLLKVNINCRYITDVNTLKNILISASCIALNSLKRSSQEVSDQKLLYGINNLSIVNVCLDRPEILLTRLLKREWVKWFENGRHPNKVKTTIKIPHFIEDQDFYKDFCCDLSNNISLKINSGTIFITGLISDCFRYVEGLVLSFCRHTVQVYCQEYCVKHNLKVPIRYSSVNVDKVFSFQFNYHSNLDFLSVLDKYFTTHITEYPILLQEGQDIEFSRYVKDKGCFDYINVVGK